MGMKVMKNIVTGAVGACAAVFCQTASAQEEIPLEYFALREVIQNVELSPDGKHLSLMKIEGRTGDPIIEIYKTDDLTEKPIRLGADPMEFVGHNWVSDDLIVFGARQRIRKRIEGYNQGVFENVVASYSMKDEKFSRFGSNTQLVGSLPDQPNKVLISKSRSNASFDQDDPFAFARPREFYELNLETGAQKLIIKENNSIGGIGFDPQGNPRSAFGFDPSTQEQVYYGRMPGENSWREVLRRSTFNLEDFGPVGFVKDNPAHGYIITTNGNDVYGLWEYDWETGEYVDLVFRDEAADVRNVLTHPNGWERPGEVIGLEHYGPKPMKVFFDEEIEALYSQLEAAIPNAYDLSINSMSRDSSRYIVFNVGPRDPGTYYLVKDGQLRVIGKHSPLIRPEQLADVEFVEYFARDGRKIRGYITVPNSGDAPYPTVVMPHGGCFVGEMPTYDEWAQVMASRGYMVFQPQYLCSRGWGQKHFADFLTPEGKPKMQTDKHDGALYLVEQGLADLDRLAMYGWSYGGYAAGVAASLEPQIYQCVLPGAAVLDTNLQYQYNIRNTSKAGEWFSKNRYLGAVNPIDEVEKVNVPMLLIHGAVDQRVPYEHFKRYVKAIEGKGKDVQELVLEEADHFYNTLYYRHQIKLYEGIIDFLDNDCGPGGL